MPVLARRSSPAASAKGSSRACTSPKASSRPNSGWSTSTSARSPTGASSTSRSAGSKRSRTPNVEQREARDVRRTGESFVLYTAGQIDPHDRQQTAALVYGAPVTADELEIVFTA